MLVPAIFGLEVVIFPSLWNLSSSLIGKSMPGASISICHVGCLKGCVDVTASARFFDNFCQSINFHGDNLEKVLSRLILSANVSLK